VGTAAQLRPTARAHKLFERVLVGVDRSPVSAEAARQAAVLAADSSALTVLAAWTLPPPTIGVVSPDWSYERDEGTLRAGAESAVALATSALAGPSPTTKVTRGFACDVLLKEAAATEATLIAVGSHGQRRMRGILMGSTATEVVHRAPCSVLVARLAGERFPRRVVVGIDGSRESAAAYEVAVEIADRFEAELWPVVAHGGKGVDKEAVASVVDYHHEDSPTEPVQALVTASADADLAIVGSRGLHGFKALGSVSERVAHQAHCSTLIVRHGVEA
jgi:nucleotide-binding universal stress UspA family protein